MRGSGGTSGGIPHFLIGAAMLFGAIWMFLDSVWVGTGHGYLSRYYGGSMLITLAPLGLGIFMLFLNSSNKIAWVVSGIGLLVIAVDVIGSLHFRMHLKLWQLVILMVFAIGGGALIMKSFK